MKQINIKKIIKTIFKNNFLGFFLTSHQIKKINAIAIFLLFIFPVTANAGEHTQITCKESASIWIRVGAGIPSFSWNHYFNHYDDYLSLIKNSTKIKPYYDKYIRSCDKYTSCTNTEPFKSYSRKINLYAKRTASLCDSKHPNYGSGWHLCMHKLDEENINKKFPKPTYCNKLSLRKHEAGINLKNESKAIAKRIINRIKN